MLHVTGKLDNSYPPTILHVQSQALSEGRIVEFDSTPKGLLHGPGKWLVSCGESWSKDPKWWPGMKSQSGAIVIVNPATLVECEDATVGEIWITGKCVTGGYWNNASGRNNQTERVESNKMVRESHLLSSHIFLISCSATSQAYSARMNRACSSVGVQHMKSSFYRTGDLGVFYRGGLYITGRLKEMIIVNGTKHYPMDLEESIRLATAAGIRIPAQLRSASVPGSIDSPPISLFLRPGGILATEMENVATGKNELVVMIELMEPPKRDEKATTSSTTSPPPPPSSSTSSDGKMSSSQVAMANTAFKYAQSLPSFIRGPTIRCLARWGAKYMKHKRQSAEKEKKALAEANGLKGAATTEMFTTVELESVEKAIRRAVMGRYGIPVAEVIVLKPVSVQLKRSVPFACSLATILPYSHRALVFPLLLSLSSPQRSILKTSSGKIRRGATASLLVQGGLNDKILRRSSVAAAAKSGAPVNSAQQWIAKPTIQASGSMNEKESSFQRSGNVNSIMADKPLLVNPKSDTDFELVESSASSSPPSVKTPSSSSSKPVSKLDYDTVRRKVAFILGEELHLDADTVLMLSQSFQFEDGQTLDEYGLDSLTAMKIAGRLTVEFELLIPISPFMFFSDPTLDGAVKLIMRLKDEKMSGKKITSAKDLEKNSTVDRPNNKAPLSSVPKSIPLDSPMSATSTSSPSMESTSSLASPSFASSSSSSCVSSNPFIFGIGCCVPGPGAPQSAIMEVMIQDMFEGKPEHKKKINMFTKIGESAGIDRRYSVLPSIEAIYFGRKGLGNNGQFKETAKFNVEKAKIKILSLLNNCSLPCSFSECVQVRNDIFKSEAPSLSLDSARAAIADWGGSKSDITHVVAVTCTGIIVPGLEFQILTGLGLETTTQRLSVQYMGCFGALSGMKAARAFAMER